jgi:hypothetical protein
VNFVVTGIIFSGWQLDFAEQVVGAGQATGFDIQYGFYDGLLILQSMHKSNFSGKVTP